MLLNRREEHILYENHQVCSEPEAGANLDQGVDICMLTPVVQCYQTTTQITYIKIL